MRELLGTQLPTSKPKSLAPSCRWYAGAATSADVIAQVNAMGCGLTLGVQTRIDSRAQALARAAHVGKTSINRNMIGSVECVQPFSMAHR